MNCSLNCPPHCLQVNVKETIYRNYQMITLQVGGLAGLQGTRVVRWRRRAAGALVQVHTAANAGVRCSPSRPCSRPPPSCSRGSPGSAPPGHLPAGSFRPTPPTHPPTRCPRSAGEPRVCARRPPAPLQAGHPAARPGGRSAPRRGNHRHRWVAAARVWAVLQGRAVLGHALLRQPWMQRTQTWLRHFLHARRRLPAQLEAPSSKRHSFLPRA